MQKTGVSFHQIPLPSDMWKKLIWQTKDDLFYLSQKWKHPNNNNNNSDRCSTVLLVTKTKASPAGPAKWILKEGEGEGGLGVAWNTEKYKIKEKFSNSRRSRMVKTIIFWPWWQHFNSFCFETLSFFPLFPFFLFATQKLGGPPCLE